MTGYEIAKEMLTDNNLINISVFHGGKLSGKYNMKIKAIFLGNDVCEKNSTYATAIAIHECGHAIQANTFYPILFIDVVLKKLFSKRFFADRIEKNASKRGIEWLQSKNYYTVNEIREIKLILNNLSTRTHEYLEYKF